MIMTDNAALALSVIIIFCRKLWLASISMFWFEGEEYYVSSNFNGHKDTHTKLGRTMVNWVSQHLVQRNKTEKRPAHTISTLSY